MRVSADSVSVWTNRNGQNWVTARVKVRWWCYGSFSRGWISPRTKSKQYANTETDTVDSGRNLPPPRYGFVSRFIFRPGHSNITNKNLATTGPNISQEIHHAQAPRQSCQVKTQNSTSYYTAFATEPTAVSRSNGISAILSPNTAVYH